MYIISNINITYMLCVLSYINCLNVGVVEWFGRIGDLAKRLWQNTYLYVLYACVSTHYPFLLHSPNLHTL